MNSPEIKAYLKLDLEGGEAFLDVVDAIEKISPKRVGAVVDDLLPSNGTSAVLKDSRDVTTYGRVLANDRALKILRSKRDFELARQVIEDVELEVKVRRIVARLDLLQQELARIEITPTLRSAVDDLFATARTMRSLANATEAS